MAVTKNDYLGSDVAKGFLRFLSGYVHGNELFHHEYQDRQSKTKWNCDSVFGAYQNYRYPLLKQFREASSPDNESFAANAAVLDKLANELRQAYAQSGGNLLEASQQVFVWGGVAGSKNEKNAKTKGNYLWLEEIFPRGRGLREAYERAHSILCSERPDLSEVGKDGTLKVRSNAGFTKIYSLLFDDFIIYDSRVAAALDLFVVKFCVEQGHHKVPDELNFGWMPPKESKNAKSPKNRDASATHASYEFSRANTEVKHAWSNVRANWIFSHLFENCPDGSPFFALQDKQARLRALESAFFMIGYDLCGHDWLSAHPEVDAMTELHTIAKETPFSYKKDTSGYRFVVGKSNSKLFLPDSFIQELVTDFSGQELVIGCSRDHPDEGSLGAMLKDKVSQTAMASYVAPLLLHLGVATKGSSTRTILLSA